MKNIELVVKLDEEVYKHILSMQFYIPGARNGKSLLEKILKAIRTSTPLPKGHGRLIDADILRNEMEKDPRRAMSFVDLEDFVLLAPTIIEKDKEQKDDNT